MKSLFVLSVIIIAAQLVFADNNVQTYSYGSGDFSSHPNDFQVNGVANAQSDGFHLTPSAGGQVGSFFLKAQVSLTGGASFSTAYSFIMSNGGGGRDSDGVWGADGIVFIVNSLTNVVGAAGGGMGYQGLQHSIGVEADSWNNGYPTDIDGNHIGIDINGDLTSSGGSTHAPSTLNDGSEKFVWVDFNGATKVLEVRFATSASRPSSPLISSTVDLVSILGSDTVYIGFSAATGGAYENHIVKSWSFVNTFQPIVAPPSGSVCGNGIVEGSEQCDGGSCCTSTCTFSSSATVCRASAGVCDVAEMCTGSSSTCPSDSFFSSSTVCRASAGVCDVAEMCTGSSTTCPSDSFASSSTVCRASAGPCDPSETCTGSSANCPADVNGGIETTCSGLDNFANFDVISFGDFSANTGDVEGRVAVAGNFYSGNGWSVGYQTHSISTDETLPYALYVGGNVVMGSGAVYPDGSNQPYPGAQENIFAAGSFSGPDYFTSRVSSCGDSTCAANVATKFSNVHSCYNSYQTALASNSDNVNVVIQWSGLYLTCQDQNALEYFVTLTASQMTQYTWISMSQCNSNARWVINVPGTDDVHITSGSFPATAAAVTYNILNSGRTINIQNTQVDGSILAPNNFVNQPSGVIVGKVCASSVIMSLQVNKQQCFFAS
jgi:choice-of-anchor A domain-containing protein